MSESFSQFAAITLVNWATSIAVAYPVGYGQDAFCYIVMRADIESKSRYYDASREGPWYGGS